ncbi:MAG TPA: histidine--tRNA ligase [Candidatus Saccharibacteria bacterium]|nr:histidine--tRNA ligase [Candidatus Saccharibacteria bacterium]HMR38351.1 histidine--tRNA ligase [Candidatus Saccharibacteria bacterium]
MSKLTTDPYKGTRDFFPEDMWRRDYIFGIWRRVMRRYGYQAYDAPLLEPLELYAVKSGDELVNEQTYQFIDRGDRKVAIRPEMTPSVSRMIAAKRQETAYPARWFSIAQFMRYERPQRGREREFWQLNADLFGINGIEAEAEIIGIGDETLKEFGAKPEFYEIRINSRQLIDLVMTNYLQLDTIQSHLMIKLFDRKNKISHEQFRDQAIEIFGAETAPEGLARLAELLGVRTIAELPEAIRDSEAAKELGRLMDTLSERAISSASFDITLMRGFDYYTGVVFEFFDTHPDNNRSLFGGGRYDGLVGLFGADPVSAVGFAPGYSMTELFLEVHNLLPKFSSTTDVYVGILEGAETGAFELARRLRKEGVNVELDFTGRKLDKQLKTAIKKQVKYLLFVGANELAEELYALKNLSTSEEQKVSFERMVTVLKDRRHKPQDEDDTLFDLEI